MNPISFYPDLPRLYRSYDGIMAEHNANMMRHDEWIRLEQQRGMELWQRLGGAGNPPWFGAASQDFYDRVMLLHRDEIQNKVPPTNFLANQAEITDHERYILVEWMAEVNDEFKLDEAALHLAVNLVDRILACCKDLPRSQLQLLGATAHFIASKFIDVLPPKLNDFCNVCNGAYRREHLKVMELKILTALNFELHVPTSLSFAAYYWNLLMTGTIVGPHLRSLEEVGQAWKGVMTQLRAQLMRAAYAEHHPSELAALAISHTLFEKRVPQEIFGPAIYRLSGYLFYK